MERPSGEHKLGNGGHGLVILDELFISLIKKEFHSILGAGYAFLATLVIWRSSMFLLATATHLNTRPHIAVVTFLLSCI